MILIKRFKQVDARASGKFSEILTSQGSQTVNTLRRPATENTTSQKPQVHRAAKPNVSPIGIDFKENYHEININSSSRTHLA